MGGGWALGGCWGPSIARCEDAVNGARYRGSRAEALEARYQLACGGAQQTDCRPVEPTCVGGRCGARAYGCLGPDGPAIDASASDAAGR